MDLEGSISQNVDIGLSFCFIVSRRWKLEEKYNKSQKLPVFVIKLKLRPKQKNLKQSSLDENVLYTHPKCGISK